MKYIKSSINSIVLPLFLCVSSSMMTMDNQRNLNNQLLDAARNNNVTRVEQLLDRGANVNATSNNGRTALHWAAFFGHVDCIKLLLNRGANINATDNLSGYTALHEAALNGHVDCINLLLAGGANVNATDNRGRTALNVAQRFSNTRTSKILEQRQRLDYSKFHDRTIEITENKLNHELFKISAGRLPRQCILFLFVHKYSKPDFPIRKLDKHLLLKILQYILYETTFDDYLLELGRLQHNQPTLTTTTTTTSSTIHSLSRAVRNPVVIASASAASAVLIAFLRRYWR